MSTALNAFKVCGIFPYNDQIFTDANFVAAEATDIELNAEERRSADAQQPPLTPLDQNTLQLSLPQEQGIIHLPQTLQPSQSVSQPSTSITDERQLMTPPPDKNTLQLSLLQSEKNEKPKRKATKQVVVIESDSETEEDAECLYCQGLYSKSNEGWVTCQICEKWAHCGCAGVEDNDDETTHICPVCEDNDD
ncbi:hypothetical protein ILUMI_20968 [Ignelater luminosus]|uniref:PHD-type domain-containing protein n=1 Tax=Ignelater luminosus TaxID=2038154 RepID=A0A8K0CHA4_IGNLU|nr:hypothetical protein ILUMI_20968 [Ignelater luminosus]